MRAAWKLDWKYKADASLVATEIYKDRTSAKPEEVVEIAKNPECELHKCFDWDNEIAGEKWRLEQARDILRNLVIVNIEKEVPQKTNLRLTHKIDNSGYKLTVNIVRNQNEYELLLRQALKELDTFKRKYACLSELEQIMELIDEL